MHDQGTKARPRYDGTVEKYVHLRYMHCFLLVEHMAAIWRARQVKKTSEPLAIWL
jgi:hypothetical protein